MKTNTSAAFLVILFLLTACAGSSEQIKLSDSDRNTAFFGSDTMAQCAAMYESMSRLYATQPDKQETAKSMHELANGWKTASSWNLFTLGAMDQLKGALSYADSVYGVSLQKELSLIEDGVDAYMAYNQTIKPKCDDLNDYQVSLVQDLRRKLHTLPDNN